MSNPAVIYLASTLTKRNGSFKVEDNIGEAIHIHYDNFRIDLTTKEFLGLTSVVEESVEKLINIPNFKVSNYDPAFLSMISSFLIDLKEVSFEEVPLLSLQIVKKGFLGFSVVANLKKSRVYRALNGDNSENNSYSQKNFYNQTNQERAELINKKISKDGYPYNNEYIVLFNDQNLIRDGQHRASALLKKGETGNVKIIRLIFKNNKYSSNMHPWLNELFFIKKLIKNSYRFSRKVYSKLKRYIKS